MNKEELVLKSLLKKEPQHIRELARNTKLNPNTVITITNILKAKNLIEIEKKDKKDIKFSDNIKTKNYKIWLIIDEIINSGLIKYLDEIFEIPTIILFGSARKGNLNSNSDIDICIISEKKTEIDLKKFEKIIGREIQPFIFTKKEFKKLEKELLNNIINGIVLTGFIEAF
jgi:predicted nucleotidyltransferase